MNTEIRNITREIKLLDGAAEVYRKLIKHYNKAIRLSRQTLKKYGDFEGFTSISLRTDMKNRYLAKLGLAKVRRKSDQCRKEIAPILRHYSCVFDD